MTVRRRAAIRIEGIPGLPAVREGDSIPRLLAEALERSSRRLEQGDIVVVCQKIVSKAEGRAVNLEAVTPGSKARQIARQTDKDPRLVEIILRETRRIVRAVPGALIVETRSGLVCANAGVDQSNAPAPSWVTLLPADPDASAEGILKDLQATFRCGLGVIVSDSFGRPWRVGQIETAIGITGIAPLLDLRGKSDLAGRKMTATVKAAADELAAAAGLIMNTADGVPAAQITGADQYLGQGRIQNLIRAPEKDLFR